MYILESLMTGEYYIGQTDDLQKRLERHNAGKSRATKHARPWKVIYTEEYATRSEAIRRERYLKRLKSRKAIQKLARVQSISCKCFSAINKR